MNIQRRTRNISLDFSARKIGLKGLRMLKWHRECDTAGQNGRETSKTTKQASHLLLRSIISLAQRLNPPAAERSEGIQTRRVRRSSAVLGYEFIFLSSSIVFSSSSILLLIASIGLIARRKHSGRNAKKVGRHHPESETDDPNKAISETKEHKATDAHIALLI